MNTAGSRSSCSKRSDGARTPFMSATSPPSRPSSGSAARAAPAAPPLPAARSGGASPDWRAIAYHVLVSRMLDEIEESTNRNKTSVPREHLVLYQFSARGHEVAQVILGSLLDGAHDAAGAYYRSRPLLLTLGLSIEDALASPLGRSGGFSDGRDIGVVCNLPKRTGGLVLPMAGDVGGQYTPAAGWAQSIQYHGEVLGDSTYAGSIAVALGGEASVATNGFWSALTMATTLRLPMLFYIEDNGIGISVRREMQTPGGNIADNLASFAGLLVRDGDGTNPGESARLLQEAVRHVRAGHGPALVHLTVPRLANHSGPDNQKGYRSDDEIAADWLRDPLPKLRAHLVPAILSESEWGALERDVDRDVTAALAGARARPVPNPATVKRFVYAEAAEDGAEHPATVGGLSETELATLGGTTTRHDEGPVIRFAEAVRRTLARELEVNPKALVFGEDVGVKGGVHLVTEGLQKRFGRSRVFDTSLSEEGIIWARRRHGGVGARAGS